MRAAGSDTGLLFVSAACLLIATLASAHGIHIGSEIEDSQIPNASASAQTGPHGGAMGKMEEHRLELLTRGEDRLLAYLYSKDIRPVSVAGKEAVIHLELPDGARVTLPLKPVVAKNEPTGHLEGLVDMSDIGAFTAVVSLKIDGVRRNLRFRWSSGGSPSGPPGGGRK